MWQNLPHSLSDEGYQAMLEELDTEGGMMALAEEEKAATGVTGTLEVVGDEDTDWLNEQVNKQKGKMSFRCIACNDMTYQHLDKTDGLCLVCYGASKSQFTYTIDHEFSNIRGSGYTVTDAMEHHSEKDATLSN